MKLLYVRKASYTPKGSRFYINPNHVISMDEEADNSSLPILKDGEVVQPTKTTFNMSDGSIINDIIGWEEVDFKQRGEKVS